MATRGAIGIENQDGTVTGIYSHWDSYPEHNGKILVENYTNEEKVRELISLGNVSVLAPSIGEAQDFDSPVKGTCVFYGRDRDEEEQEAVTLHSAKKFVKYFDNEYHYLFRNGVWFVSCNGDDWEEVSVVLAADETA